MTNDRCWESAGGHVEGRNLGKKIRGRKISEDGIWEEIFYAAEMS